MKLTSESCSWAAPGLRRDMGWSHSPWARLLIFKIHFKIDRAKHKMRKVIRLEKRVLHTHQLHLHNRAFICRPESIGGPGSHPSKMRSCPGERRTGAVPASFHFSKSPLADSHHRSALSPLSSPITAAVSLSSCALIGPPRNRSAPGAFQRQPLGVAGFGF